MMFGAALLLVLLIAGSAAGISLSRHHPIETGANTAPGVPGTVGTARSRPVGRPHQRRTIDPRLGIQLDRWVASGLLSPDQADAIAAHELSRRPTRPGPAPSDSAARTVTTAPQPAHRRFPVVAEALGYIGGILGAVGVVMLVGRSWDDLATPVRLGVAGATAVALVAAGWMVHEAADPALARLRWTLWLASTAATGLFAGVLGDQSLALESDERIALVVAAAIAFQSGMLWWNRPRPAQQVTMLVGLVLAVGLFVDQFAGELVTGAVVWTVGAAIVLLGLRRLTTLPIISLTIGAIATVAGTLVIASGREGIGFPLVCLDAAVLIALAVTGTAERHSGERIVLAAIGVFGMLQGLPQTIVWFADQAGLATGLVVWATGAALLTVAARRHIRAAIAIEVVGSIAMVGGAAITGVQSQGFATVFGVMTAVGFVVLGMLPGRVLMSLFGSAGLLVFVPWTIAHYFPGEDRAPLLILVSGVLLVAIAVLLTRQGSRLRNELRIGTTATGDTDIEGPQASDATTITDDPDGPGRVTDVGSVDFSRSDMRRDDAARVDA